jgi:hypothetical protein
LGPLLERFAPLEDDGDSGLNHDGSALQLCLCLGAERFSWRAILDPALGQASANERHRRALVAMARELAAQNAHASQTMVDVLMSVCGPGSDRSIAEFSQGVFWLGAELGGSGRSIYVDASVRPPAETWLRAKQAFLTCATEEGTIASTLDALAQLSYPSSIGLEARGDTQRLKLHCRLHSTPPEGLLGSALPMLAHSCVLEAVSRLMPAENGLSLHGFVIEAAFDSQTGALADAKLDFAMPELCTAEDALNRSRGAAAALGLDWPERLVDRFAKFARLSYVGVGRSAQGKARLNLYFKPSRST